MSNNNYLYKTYPVPGYKPLPKAKPNYKMLARLKKHKNKDNRIIFNNKIVNRYYDPDLNWPG